MSDELARLRADLKALDEIRARYDKDADFTTLVNNMRDRLEAAADPWREAKGLLIRYRGSLFDTGKMVAYSDHLSAEVARLTARVAELEKEPEFTPAVLKRADEVATGDIVLAGGTIRAVTMIDADHSNHPNKRIIKCDGWMGWLDNHDLIAVLHKPLVEAKTVADMQPPFEGPIVGIDPVLEPARVLATAVNVLGSLYKKKQSHEVWTILQNLDQDAKPYPLKGGE